MGQLIPDIMIHFQISSKYDFLFLQPDQIRLAYIENLTQKRKFMKSNFALISVCFIFVVAQLGCSSFSRTEQSQQQDPKPATVEMVAATSPVITGAGAQATTPVVQAQVSGAPASIEKVDSAKVEAKLAPVKEAVEKINSEVEHKKEVHQHAKGIDPEKAMKWLKNGNTRFTKGTLRNDGQKMSDVARLAAGQKPHSIVLSCSDSRVPPELVFDQKLGEIFVVRTAGEAIDPSAIASIEYALEHLGARNIIVLGHTQCGAIKAALATKDGKDAGSANLNKLVADLHPRLKNFSHKNHSADYGKEAFANAKGVAADLMTRSELISSRVKSGEAKITAALYNLSNGQVIWE